MEEKILIFTSERDYAFICKKCQETAFKITPNGKAVCTMCNSIYSYDKLAKEWLRVVKRREKK